MLATEIAIRAELASADMDAVIQRARDDAEARVLLSFVPTPAMFTSFISKARMTLILWLFMSLMGDHESRTTSAPLILPGQRLSSWATAVELPLVVRIFHHLCTSCAKMEEDEGDEVFHLTVCRLQVSRTHRRAKM